jgi:hypothetical protein
MTKSTNTIIRLPNIVHISFFVIILFRKISSEMCIYSLLLIANGIAHTIDQIDTPPAIILALAAPEVNVKADDYLIAIAVPEVDRNAHDYAEMM